MTPEEFAQHQRTGRANYFPPVVDVSRRGPHDGWSERAACRGTDSDLFFPPTSRPTADQLDAIMARCGNCPVGGECLAWALRGEEYGWWGATSPSERARLRTVLDIPFVYTARDLRRAADVRSSALTTRKAS